MISFLSRHKNPRKNISKLNPVVHKKTIYQDQFGFISGKNVRIKNFKLYSLQSIIFNRLKEKNHKILSTDAEHHVTKLQRLSELNTEYLQKLLTNVIFNGETFPLKVWNKICMPLIITSTEHRSNSMPAF